MADVTNELMYEVLKAIQREQSSSTQLFGEVRNELVAIRLHSLGVQTDIKNIYETLAKLETRLERIERRVGLIGEPAE